MPGKNAMPSKPKVLDMGPPKGKVIGWEYVGCWWGGELGWYIGHFVGGAGKRRTNGLNGVPGWVLGHRLYLCKVTLEPIKDKRGRYITRIARKHAV